MNRVSKPTCPVCGERAAERTDVQEIEGGPYSADPNQREIVQVFKCRCGASFATSKLAPLEEMAA